MEDVKYLVIHKNTKGEEIASEWFYDIFNVQEYMVKLLGHSFIAKVMRFKGHTMNGLMNMTSDTTLNQWVKI